MIRTARILGNAVRGMRRNGLRTFLMMLGTLVGVTALTIILALGRRTERDVLDRMDRMLGGSTILLRAGGGHGRGGPHGPVTTTLTLGDMDAIARGVAAVAHVDPTFTAGGREVTYGTRSARITVIGHSEASEIVWNRSAARGAYFTAADVANHARVALVGEVVVRDLFDGRDPIGEQIRIGSVPFQVIGVLERVGMDPHGIDKDNEIIIPISTMMRRVMNVDHVMVAKIALEPGTDPDVAVLEVAEILRARHGIGPDQADDFATFTPAQARHAVASATRVFTMFLPLVAFGSILVGGLVVANLMFMAVSERRAEIGLRRAIGARTRDIRLQFLSEAVAVTALGGVIAVAAAYAIVAVLALHGEASASMPWDAALIGLAAAVATGILAGTAPARRAAALDPVQTLR